MIIATWLRGDISIRKGAMRISVSGQVEKYHKEYETVLKQHRDEFKYLLYKVDDRRLVHLKIPSSVEGMFYDVVIEFMKFNPADLELSDIHVFSNSPAFVFTSAFALLSYGDYINTGKLLRRGSIRRGNDCQLVEGLENKLSDRALMEPPNVRNPTQIALPDKTVYFGIFYILEKISPEQMLEDSTQTSIQRIAAEIPDFEAIMQMRRNLDKAHKEEKKQKYDEEMNDLKSKEKKNTGVTNSKGVQQPKSPLRPKSLNSVTSKNKVKSLSQPKKPTSPRTSRSK